MRRNHAPPMDVIPIDDGVARANAIRGTRPDGGPQSCSTCGCYPDQTAGRAASTRSGVKTVVHCVRSNPDPVLLAAVEKAARLTALAEDAAARSPAPMEPLQHI